MTPTPELTAGADQFHQLCKDVLDKYVESIEDDMNAYAVKNGKPMDLTFAHNDLTRILTREIKPGVLAGLVSEAILRTIQKKARGKR